MHRALRQDTPRLRSCAQTYAIKLYRPFLRQRYVLCARREIVIRPRVNPTEIPEII
jgi:hypothetical protein